MSVSVPYVNVGICVCKYATMSMCFYMYILMNIYVYICTTIYISYGITLGLFFQKPFRVYCGRCDLSYSSADKLILPSPSGGWIGVVLPFSLLVYLLKNRIMILGKRVWLLLS